jgi:hypothetical protein
MMGILCLAIRMFHLGNSSVNLSENWCWTCTVNVGKILFWSIFVWNIFDVNLKKYRKNSLWLCIVMSVNVVCFAAVDCYLQWMDIKLTSYLKNMYYGLESLFCFYSLFGYKPRTDKPFTGMWHSSWKQFLIFWTLSFFEVFTLLLECYWELKRNIHSTYFRFIRKMKKLKFLGSNQRHKKILCIGSNLLRSEIQ